MKRFLKSGLSIFLAITIIFSSAIVGLNEIDFNGLFEIKAEAASIDDLSFKLNDDGESYSVSACNVEAYGELIIPAKYNGKPVTRIGSSAFLRCEGLSRVDIPYSVKIIEYGAFLNCFGLTEVNLSEGLIEIESDAFWNCYRLKRIVIPKSVKKIGDGVFQSCLTKSDGTKDRMAIQEIVVEKGNENYCSVDGVLYNKDKTILIQYPVGRNDLSYSVPSSVKNIGNSAFENGIYLEDIYLSDNVVRIGSGAFVNTANYNNVNNWSNGVLYLNNHLIQCDAEQMIKSTYVVKAGTKTIAEGAFYRCCNLKKVTLPDGLKTIGESAFLGCNKMNSIKIPASVTSMGSYSVGYIILPETDLGYTYQICKNTAFKIYCHCNSEALAYAKSHFFDYEVEETDKHKSSDWKIRTVATCTEVGYKYKDCKICGTILIEEKIPATGHKPSGWKIRYATTIGCECEGLKYKECTVCREYLEEQTFQETVHESSDWITVKKPTVYKAGEKHKECTFCGEVIKTTKIAQLKCSKPTLKKVENTASGVKITFNKVKGGDAYNIYRKTKNGSYSKVGSTKNNYFIDKKAKSGKRYYYIVKAVNEAGSSAASKAKTILHLADPTLKKVTNSEYGVKITWGKVSGADKYNVYRKTSSGSYSKIGTTKKTYYTDKKVKSGRKYYYIVKAVKGSATSASSSAKSILHLADPTLKTPSSTKSGITLKWTKVTGAQGYIIYRKTGSGSYTKLKTEKGVSNLSYTDKSAKKGKTYTYKVKAYKGKTYSAYSNAKKIKDRY